MDAMTFPEWMELLVTTTRVLPDLSPYVVYDGGGDATYIAVGPELVWGAATATVLRSHGWEPCSDGYLWKFPLPPKP